MEQQEFDSYVERVNRVTAILMQVWEEVEGQPVGPSYIATFASMARSVVRDEMGIHE